MRTGVALLVICVGAILAFAVTANTSVFNLHTAGYVLIVVGVAGLLVHWRGRRVLVRRRVRYDDVPQVPDQVTEEVTEDATAGTKVIEDVFEEDPSAR